MYGFVGPVADSSKVDNELSGSIICWEFVELLRNCWLFKMDSAPWS
jgi:hypothetical protein